ncbi:MAG TPA: hypothetical protein VMI94_15550 [Bryobacteraceae bacterium]|nr:hypothetical protein [Bryobacteraceae bacterium]
MLTGIHVLLTYRCTYECDHCFLHCGPNRAGAFTLPQLRTLFHEIAAIGTIRTVYFEGGEPFLHYATLLEGVRMAHAAGLESGIVTNAYWATSLDDAICCLRPFCDLNVTDLSISDDEFHDTGASPKTAQLAEAAAARLGISCSKVCIERPRVADAAIAHKGQPVTGGPVLFKGRAAEKLVAGLPVRPAAGMTSCRHEDLAAPERVHVDAYGNVHLCQGISMGNMATTPLSVLVRDYDPAAHPIAGPLLRGGPAQLARDFGFPADATFVDECHLCYTIRKSLVPRFPAWLAPREAYGLEPCSNSVSG